MVREVSFASAGGDAEAVADLGTKVDLVAVTRGGGTGVEDLDADVLLEAVSRCPVPTVVAVGHAVDVLVLEQVASRAFPTPTAFGAWMRSALERKRARATEAAQVRAVKEQGDLAKANAELTRANAELTGANQGLRATVARLTTYGQERAAESAQLQERLLETSKASQAETGRLQARLAALEARGPGEAIAAAASAAAARAEAARLRSTARWLKVGVAGLAAATAILLVLVVLGV